MKNATLQILLTCMMLRLVTVQAMAGGVPQVVLEYADVFITSQAMQSQPPARSMPDEYALWFFQGFTHPDGGAFSKAGIAKDAYTTGQRYWREHPSGRADIFAGYGYQIVEREGVWSRGFEASDFTPDDAGKGTWWMGTLGGVAWNDIGLVLSGPSARASHVHIVGYLSPQGRYGHLGAYGHEVLVTSAMLVDVGER